MQPSARMGLERYWRARVGRWRMLSPGTVGPAVEAEVQEEGRDSGVRGGGRSRRRLDRRNNRSHLVARQDRH